MKFLKEIHFLALVLPLQLPYLLSAEEALPEPRQTQADWGIAAMVRTANIPYASQNDTVSSFVPMLFDEGERFFMRGIGGGMHVLEDEAFELNVIGRLRFVDLPNEYQNVLQGDTVDFGLQFHQPLGKFWWEAELLTEDKGNWHANARIGRSHATERWVVSYSLDLQYGSDSFISRYYALEPLTGLDANSSIVFSPAITARYQLVSDLHLVGSLRYNAFGSEIRGLETIDESGTFEAWLGFGFFQNRDQPTFGGKIQYEDLHERGIDLAPNIRVSHGWATPSNLGSILGGEMENDPYNNQLSSIFYHHPLTDRLLGLPIDIFFGTGLAWHWSSEVQDSTFELVGKIHLYYTFTWPIRWRVGAAEGFSWIEEVTYIEGEDMEEKGYRPSQLMNYLDFTLDVNLGDLFRSSALENTWLGLSIHHRSSIFESASQFGRIKGGSNYPSIYLQWDLP